MYKIITFTEYMTKMLQKMFLVLTVFDGNVFIAAGHTERLGEESDCIVLPISHMYVHKL
jgi:hypothetical protein